MIIVMVLALILATNGHAAFAAYKDPVIISNERQSSGATKLIFRFNGDNGEPAVTREYAIGAETTMPILRDWVASTIVELNKVNLASTVPALQAGRTITGQALTAPPPTAKDVWQGKMSMYQAVKDLGLTGQFVEDLAALKADLQATYQTGYLDAN